MESKGDASPMSWNEVGTPKYSTILGAIDHVSTTVFAEFDTGDYYDNPMTIFFFPLLLLLVFCECIILLNILIAVMNTSFSQNSEIAESTKRIQQLEFVVDNWWVNPCKGKKVVYLVAAFSMDNENQSDEKFDVL